MRTALDRMAAAAARRLLALIAQRLDPARQTWLEALHAELERIDA